MKIKIYRDRTTYPFKEYKALWQKAKVATPYLSPESLHALWEYFDDSQETIEIWHFFKRNSDKLFAVLPLRYKKKNYKLLSDGFSDYQYIIIKDDTDIQTGQTLFKLIVSEIRKRKSKLFWKNFPMFSFLKRYIESESTCFSTGFISFKHSMFPTLKSANPQGVFSLLDTKKLRYYRRRLLKLGASFETIEDKTDFDDWVDSFVHNHICRWENHYTPSKYEDSKNIVLLKKRLLAWHNDNVLIRFSIKLNDSRIAFCIALKEDNRLIYHSIAHNSEYNKYNPGTALIHYIGEQMCKREHNILDFGEGDESYKLNFSNSELDVHKLYITT